MWGRGQAINLRKAAVKEEAEKLPQKDLLAFSTTLFVRSFLFSLVKLRNFRAFFRHFPFPEEKCVKSPVIRQIRVAAMWMMTYTYTHRSIYLSVADKPRRWRRDSPLLIVRTAQTELQCILWGLQVPPLPQLTSPGTVTLSHLLSSSNNRISYINHWRLSLSLAVWQLSDEFFQPQWQAQRRSQSA